MTRGQGAVFCFDSDAAIGLQEAKLLRRLRKMARNGCLKMPGAVYRELQRRTDRLAKTLQGWESKYSIVAELDRDPVALELLPRLEKDYGNRFRVGRRTYRGFWESSSGRRSADGQVVALAKARGWIVVSNDNSIHGACMLEGVECWRWESVGRLLLTHSQLVLPME